MQQSTYFYRARDQTLLESELLIMDRWIKIYASIVEHWIWKNSHQLQWWVDMLLMASYEDKNVCIGKNLYTIGRGQFIISYSFLRARWTYITDKGRICMPSSPTLKKYLDLLEKNKMIIRDTSILPNKATLITICNYEKYQGSILQDNNTTNIQKIRNKEKVAFDYSIVDEAYMDAITMWLDYKKKRHESYKNQKSFEQLYKKMLKIGSPEEVMKAVKNSMANNYAGLFCEKNQNKQKEESIKDATDLIKELITQRSDTSTKDIWNGGEFS